MLFTDYIELEKSTPARIKCSGPIKHPPLYCSVQTISQYNLFDHILIFFYTLTQLSLSFEKSKYNFKEIGLNVFLLCLDLKLEILFYKGFFFRGGKECTK